MTHAPPTQKRNIFLRYVNWLNTELKKINLGAMCVATGWACSGCFTFSSDLAQKLTKAGEKTGDRIWRMPVFVSHKKKIAPAPLADLNNTGD